MELSIAKHGWQQVGGDMNPGAHGAVIARADREAIQIRRIDPVRSSVGDRDAVEVGFPFWSRDGWFDLGDLDPYNKEVLSALRMYGDDPMKTLRDLKPESRAMFIAEALLDYGRGDQGPHGWAKDVVPGPVLWWGTKRPQGWRYLQDEDVEFRRLLREARRA